MMQNETLESVLKKAAAISGMTCEHCVTDEDVPRWIVFLNGHEFFHRYSETETIRYMYAFTQVYAQLNMGDVEADGARAAVNVWRNRYEW